MARRPRGPAPSSVFTFIVLVGPDLRLSQDAARFRLREIIETQLIRKKKTG